MIWLLGLIALGGLFLTAIGLPGTWIFLASAVLLKLSDPALALAWWPIWVGIGLALIAEGIEFVAASGYAKRYGGSTRAGWGALIGGIAGAFVGFPVPIVGPLVGALVGTFLGALVAEVSVSGANSAAGRVAWGALIGRLIATVAKVSIGVMIAVLVLASTLV
jgi:uncharacterized protein YqgC (DUF456 family)